jgi:hypothetical protein
MRPSTARSRVRLIKAIDPNILPAIALMMRLDASAADISRCLGLPVRHVKTARTIVENLFMIWCSLGYGGRAAMENCGFPFRDEDPRVLDPGFPHIPSRCIRACDFAWHVKTRGAAVPIQTDREPPATALQ